MANEKMGEKQLKASRIVRSINRSDARKDVHVHLCEAYPTGETKEQIAEATGYDKETVMGALIGGTVKYRAEDALVTIGLATMREEELYGQKVMIFTAISDGDDVDVLLRNYARNSGLLSKLKEYARQLEKILGNRKKKKQP